MHEVVLATVPAILLQFSAQRKVSILKLEQQHHMFQVSEGALNACNKLLGVCVYDRAYKKVSTSWCQIVINAEDLQV